MSTTDWRTSGEKKQPRIAFSRITQLGFLCLMTTAAAMDGKPLTMAKARERSRHDRLFEDNRVAFVSQSQPGGKTCVLG
jgi:hypothetical protein